MAYLEDENATPTVVRISNGDRTMPSVVSFTRLGHVVGKRAKTDVRWAMTRRIEVQVGCHQL